MTGLSFLASPILLAQGAQAAGGEGGLSNWTIILFQFGPVVLLFFLFFVWMPSRQRKQHADMINALKKNDRVVTSSGIYGTVVSVDEKADRLVLRIDDEKGVKLSVRKSSVAGLVEAAGGGAAEKKPS